MSGPAPVATICAMRSILALILSLLTSAAAFAYNPPSDTVGPLTVQMQPPAVGAYGAGGYADMARAGAPFVVPVSLQNAGDREITGTLRMSVIDGWKVAPAEALPFQIRAHGRLRREFTLSFAPATHNAHYPIHVYAEFDWGGQKLIAHPVMMVQPRIPDCRVRNCPWSGSRFRFPRAARWGCGVCRFGANQLKSRTSARKPEWLAVRSSTPEA